MNYEETKEYELSLKITKKAEEIKEGFLRNVVLDLRKYKDDKFEVWSDMHNACYVKLTANGIVYICDFLHENYRLVINNNAIFTAIKDKDRSVNHAASAAKVSYNEHDYKKD